MKTLSICERKKRIQALDHGEQLQNNFLISQS